MAVPGGISGWRSISESFAAFSGFEVCTKYPGASGASNTKGAAPDNVRQRDVASLPDFVN
jgi:hypothetical protein